MACFSPVAGIQWVETSPGCHGGMKELWVSVPLPGFSGLRHLCCPLAVTYQQGFSPVAGIQWVETNHPVMNMREFDMGFSPVAGIQWVETLKQYSQCRYNRTVSVPLPGFSGLRLLMNFSSKKT